MGFDGALSELRAVIDVKIQIIREDTKWIDDWLANSSASVDPSFLILRPVIVHYKAFRDEQIKTLMSLRKIRG